MTDTKRILFFTNSEYGQANVAIATAYELLIRGYEIHIASFAADELLGSSLPRRIDALNSGQYGRLPTSTLPVAFHEIKGESMVESWMRRRNLDPEDPTCTYGCGVKAATEMYGAFADLFAFDAAGYIEGAESCVEIVRNVRPSVVVIDRACCHALEAANMLGIKYVVLTPNTFKETLGFIQPYGYGFWGIPADCSGFPYPIPWYLKPVNVYLWIRYMLAFFFCPGIKNIEKARSAKGLGGKFPLLTAYNERLHYLIPTALEIDFPFKNIPNNVTACGPIIVPTPPLSLTDPELDTWLKRNPTVMLSLGSHFISSAIQAESIATAFASLLQKHPNVQILWKLNTRHGNDAKAKAILKPYMDQERIRIVSWLKAEPASILQSGHVRCIIHHGGANSYYEAVDAGVAQIILPIWIDTYDFATRVEYLGIGLWGSRRARANSDFVYADELGDALLTVMDSENGDGRKMVESSGKLGKCARAYGGRKTAAENIVEFSKTGEFGF